MFWLPFRELTGLEKACDTHEIHVEKLDKIMLILFTMFSSRLPNLPKLRSRLVKWQLFYSFKQSLLNNFGEIIH